MATQYIKSKYDSEPGKPIGAWDFAFNQHTSAELDAIIDTIDARLRPAGWRPKDEAAAARSAMWVMAWGMLLGLNSSPSVITDTRRALMSEREVTTAMVDYFVVVPHSQGAVVQSIKEKQCTWQAGLLVGGDGCMGRVAL